MQRSETLYEKQDKNLENEAQTEPKAKKRRSDNRISTIPTMDNGTLVEAFKYLNYCQLAKNSLVSKRFCDLICTNRHSLALLYVDTIRLERKEINPIIIMFGKDLSPESYNEWVTRNHYSKQIPCEGQATGQRSTRYTGNVYTLEAEAKRKDQNCIQCSGSSSVLYARGPLNHENWPLFQHFVRLITAPFIYIAILSLPTQNDVLNLLSGAMNPDRNRLKCCILNLELIGIDGYVQKFIRWVKDHVVCKSFNTRRPTIYSGFGCLEATVDEELLDLLSTGAHCTSDINTNNYSLSEMISGLVKKFLDLKNSDECQIIPSITGISSNRSIELLKRNYAEYIANEEGQIRSSVSMCTSAQALEFVNNDVGKKLQLEFRQEIENSSDNASNLIKLRIENF